MSGSSISKASFIRQFGGASRISLAEAKKQGNLGGLPLAHADKNGDGAISGNKEAAALFKLIDDRYDADGNANSMALRDSRGTPTAVASKLDEAAALAAISMQQNAANMLRDGVGAAGRLGSGRSSKSRRIKTGSMRTQRKTGQVRSAKPIRAHGKAIRDQRYLGRLNKMIGAVENRAYEPGGAAAPIRAGEKNKILHAYNQLSKGAKQKAKRMLRRNEKLAPMVAQLDRTAQYVDLKAIPNSAEDMNFAKRKLPFIETMESKYGVNRDVLADLNPLHANELKKGVPLLAPGDGIAIPKNAKAALAGARSARIKRSEMAKLKRTNRQMMYDLGPKHGFSVDQQDALADAFTPNVKFGNKTSGEAAYGWVKEEVEGRLKDPRKWPEIVKVSPEDAAKFLMAVGGNSALRHIRKQDMNGILADVQALRAKAPNGGSAQFLRNTALEAGTMSSTSSGWGDNLNLNPDRRAQMVVSMYLVAYPQD